MADFLYLPDRSHKWWGLFDEYWHDDKSFDDCLKEAFEYLCATWPTGDSRWWDVSDAFWDGVEKGEWGSVDEITGVGRTLRLASIPHGDHEMDALRWLDQMRLHVGEVYATYLNLPVLIIDVLDEPDIP